MDVRRATLSASVVSFVVACVGVLAGCAGLPGAVKPVVQSYAPAHTAAPVVTARVCGRDGVVLPDGWRLPRADEVGDDWRSADRERFLLADADLDGDGRRDQARVLMRIDGCGYGVFAFFCRDDAPPEAHLVLHNRDLTFFRGVGIKAVEPGLYRTACGMGAIDCYGGEPHEVRLPYGGIDYFKSESVASLFYWNDDVRAFKWIAITDGAGRRSSTAAGAPAAPTGSDA